MHIQYRLTMLMPLIGLFVVIGLSPAEEKPRRGGVLTWLEYADPRALGSALGIAIVRITGGGWRL